MTKYAKEYVEDLAELSDFMASALNEIVDGVSNGYCTEFEAMETAKRAMKLYYSHVNKWSSD